MPEPRFRLRLKRIDRVAFVDKGDNPAADVVVWKRAPGDAVKALSFAEARAKMEAERETWQHTDVLHQVMRSIMEDEEMDAAAKKALMDRSIDEFASEMKGATSSMMKQRGPVARLVAAIGKRLNWTDEQVGQITNEAGDDDMSKTFDPTALSPEAKAAFDELTKRATDAEAALKAKTPETPKEPELAPEVAKRLEDTEKRAKDAEERIAKMELASRTAEFVKHAETFQHLPIKAAEFGPILRKVNDGEKLTEAEGKELDRVLSAANETARVGGIFAEVGADGDGEGTATQKVAKLAAEAKKADPKLSDVQARAQVYKSNPGLMAEVEAEDAERAKARR